MKTNCLPHLFPRKILLAVTGLSPQIVTETLFALAHQNPTGFIPTELHILTTSEGEKLAKTALLHLDGGQFHALLADYPVLGKTAFPEENIHIICDDQGEPLSDIRTPEQNAAAADAITALVAKLTRDDQSMLHVSIAGGRKTMGFYLGYAFSLFSRPQDRLSHVLVSPPFESHPDFFYPPQTARRLTTREGRHIDTSDAVITLAEIPFVRLRHGLPANLVNGKATFSETVIALQHNFAEPKLIINLENATVRCGETEVKMQRQLVAWYAWHAHRCKKIMDGENFIHWRDMNPLDFLQFYKQVIDTASDKYMALEKQFLDCDCDVESIKGFFQQKNAKVNRVLENALGQNALRYQIARTGKNPNVRHGLSLDPAYISIIGLTQGMK